MPASRAVRVADKPKARSKIGSASGGPVAARADRHIDHHVVGLARSHENFGLHAPYTGQHIAVFRDQRESRCYRSRLRSVLPRWTGCACADRRSPCAPGLSFQPGELTAERVGARSTKPEALRLVESNSVNQVIARRVVHGRRIAGLVVR